MNPTAGITFGMMATILIVILIAAFISLVRAIKRAVYGYEEVGGFFEQAGPRAESGRTDGLILPKVPVPGAGHPSRSRKTKRPQGHHALNKKADAQRQLVTGRNPFC